MSKYAKSTLEISLSKIIENYNIIKSKIAEDIEIASVVKANSYGLGAKEVTAALASHGCENFYVAYLEEALEIKDLARNANIYVLSGVNKSEVNEFENNEIIPVLNDLQQIEVWKDHASKINKKLKACIMIDTGMTRLGLSGKELEIVSGNQDSLGNLELKCILSHLACASNSIHAMNHKQNQSFKTILQKFNCKKASLANSAGVILGEDYHHNQVRPGCSLYGINPMDDMDSIFKQVATLNAKVLQIINIENDRTVSYNANYNVKKGSRIATLLCGYADGYIRSQTNKAYGYFKGYKIPIVGTVTMDYIMADVTEVPNDLLSKMDSIELLGNNVTVDEVAKNAGTIGYEVLTSLGKGRFNKVYVK